MMALVGATVGPGYRKEKQERFDRSIHNRYAATTHGGIADKIKHSIRLIFGARKPLR